MSKRMMVRVDPTSPLPPGRELGRVLSVYAQRLIGPARELAISWDLPETMLQWDEPCRADGTRRAYAINRADAAWAYANTQPGALSRALREITALHIADGCVSKWPVIPVWFVNRVWWLNNPPPERKTRKRQVMFRVNESTYATVQAACPRGTVSFVLNEALAATERAVASNDGLVRFCLQVPRRGDDV